MVGTYRYQHGDKPVDGYTILRGIGRGGFGEVYYAISDGGREVALKAIQQNTDIELRGVRHCINLKSPHLISIFDVKRNGDGASFVVMEYVAGVSLRDVIARESQGMSADKAAFLLREVAKGLSYLHERGIVHRDLKPENIFYEDGYAKIGDYGLSKYISVSRQSGQTISVGTVHYMAPEIGSGNYSQGIDVYALGIIFFELLTGTVPFNGDSMGEILMKHLTQEPDVSQLEPEFQPIVKKALAKSPTDRYASAKEMVDAVFADEELAAAVARLDAPSFLSSVTPTVDNTAATLLMAPAAGDLRGRETTPVPPPPPRREASPPLPARGRSANASRPFEAPTAWRDLSPHLVQGLAIAGASALALGLLSGRATPAVLFGYFVLVVTTATAILGVEHWFAPRFHISSGFVRRCVTFGLVGPILAGLLAYGEAVGFLPGRIDRLFLGLAAGLFAIDWHERCRRGREEHVSVGLAVAAGLFGLVAGAVTWGWNQPFLAFGLLASVSLISNAVSPFAGKDKKGRMRSASLPAEGVLTTAGAADAREKAPEAAPALAMAPPPAAFAAPPSPAATAPPLPPPRTKLIRPRSDVIAGGVCAAFARAYGWDATIVRLIVCVLLFATFPVGLVAYVVCWFILPEEAPPPKAPRPPRRPGLFRKIFLGTCALGFFAGSIAFAAETHLDRRGDLAACLALNLVGAVCLFFASKRRTGEVSPATPAPGGWLNGLGSLGLVAGIITAALAGFGGHSWAVMNGDAMEWSGGGMTDDVFKFATVGAFAFATLCFAARRFRQSVEHGLRGLLGWAGMSIVLMAGLVFGMEILHHSNHHFADSGRLSFAGLFSFAALGVVSLILLGWPARRRLPPPLPAADPVEGTLA